MNFLIISYILWSLITHYKVRFEWRWKFAPEEGKRHLYLIWVIKHWNRIEDCYLDVTYTQKLF